VTLFDAVPQPARAQVDAVLAITRSDDRGAALARVRSGEETAAIEQVGDEIKVHFSAADQTAASTVRAVVDSLIQSANLTAAGRSAVYRISTVTVEDRSLQPIQYITPGILGWAIATGAAFGAASTLVTWRQGMLLRRLQLSPVRPPAVVSARIVLSMGLALVQTGLFIALAVAFFGLTLSPHWWMSLPLILAGTLAFMSIGLLVGSLVKCEEAASAAVNLIVLPMAFLSGVFFQFDMMPEWIQQVSWLMPLRHLSAGLLDVLVRDVGVADVVLPVVVLLGVAATLSGLAAWRFSWED
jgi:ABC-2 type transport system permease protein